MFIHLKHYHITLQIVKVLAFNCHLKIKTGLFFNDLKFKSGLTQNGKKDVI